MTGSLLGDGSLEMGKQNARYAEGGANADYIKWKCEFLARYMPCDFKEKLSAPHSKSGKRYLGWWIRTAIHPELTRWRKLWYPAGAKIVPFDLLEDYLTPAAFAVWFCDDGHKLTSCDGCLLYTHSFSETEVDRLLTVLSRKLRISGTKRRVPGKAQFFIYLDAAQWPVIASILTAAAIPGMDYKNKPFARQMPKIPTPPKPRRSQAIVYFAPDLGCLRNGSLYKTSRHSKREAPYAQYINGDFMGFVAEVPERFKAMSWSRKEAKPLLPECLR